MSPRTSYLIAQIQWWLVSICSYYIRVRERMSTDSRSSSRLATETPQHTCMSTVTEKKNDKVSGRKEGLQLEGKPGCTPRCVNAYMTVFVL